MLGACLALLLLPLVPGLTLTCLVSSAGIDIAVLGVILHLTKSANIGVVGLKLGNVSVRIRASYAFLVTGLALLGWAQFIGARSFWLRFLTDEEITKKVKQQVAQELRGWPTPAEKSPAQQLSPDLRALRDAIAAYDGGEYGQCMILMDKVEPQSEDVAEESLFYGIMVRYHSYAIRVRRYETIPPDQLADLETRFIRFLEEHQESRRVCTIHYWLGHFYLQICKDEDSALRIFDEIVEHYAYSDWFQGSLYYSSLLRRKRNTPEDLRVAEARLRVLAREDGLLKIVEIDKDRDGAGVARRLLREWGFEKEPEVGQPPVSGKATNPPAKAPRPYQSRP
jgi:hypothetical protein